ncbi:Aste57867_14998 [Aphanomyces stellatus]|uniref:Aste57867_14998 protein n=1 Tax=Aphanomyces stellatus TaxID=120398 RepID=A0A485L3C9_9STRA|nr:hypothetical protein As57867_014942 [Aphanomyces stellatus]VFT91812.1 Aste57867_14998 [Aphanomyces stellatus]
MCRETNCCGFTKPSPGLSEGAVAGEMNQSEEKWGYQRPQSPAVVATRGSVGAVPTDKFRAMMAEVDNSDDEDEDGVAQPKAKRGSNAPPTFKQVNVTKAPPRNDSDDDSGDSDDEVTGKAVMPLGSPTPSEGTLPLMARFCGAHGRIVVRRRFEVSEVPRSSLPEISVDLNALRAFVTRAPAKGTQSVQCYVERDKSGVNMMRPIYRLFLDDGKQFLLGAQARYKRINNKTSNYLISMDRNPTDRRSGLIVGKLRGNWSGASYTVYDQGLNPNKTALDSNVRSILGLVEFTYDKMGPGRMAIRIPRVNSVGVPTSIKDKPEDDSKDTKAGNSGLTDDNSVKMRNKRPKYDEKARGHVLNFGGRITMSSVKNFQLQCDDGEDDADVTLQFGRVSCQPPGPNEQCSCHKNVFNLDFKYPLSAVQAFALCLAAMDGKLADNKTFETISDLAKRK